MSSLEAKQELRAAFPTTTTGVTIVRAIRDGVAFADDHRRNTPWLGNSVGDELFGTQRRAAATWRLHQLCINGDLPFSAEEVPNSMESSHLLSIRPRRFEAHVIRKDSPMGFPKNAPLRQDKRLSNAGDLFDDPKIVPLSGILEITTAYAWLSFNAALVGALAHVCWCMPQAVAKQYLASVNILKGPAADPEPASPPATKIDPTEKLKFRELVEEYIERNKSKVYKTG